jgi:hypothetical protein
MAAERYRDSVDDCLGLGYLMFIGYRRSSPGMKGPKLDAHHSSSSDTEVKNEWSYTSTPPLWLHVVLFTVCDSASVVTAFRRFDAP